MTDQSEPIGFTPPQWTAALETLRAMLTANNGAVSSIALARELRKRSVIAEPQDLIVELTYWDPENLQQRGLDVPSFQFHHFGRSFYSPERHQEVVKQAEATTEREAEDASRSEKPEPEDETPAPRANKQEEARLTAYVKRALESIYSSEFVPAGPPFVFDVHHERAGTSFENIDLLAVHWRSATVVDIVAVEVKLDFVPQAVQQAMHYRRFANRVWIAVPVASDASLSAVELRDRSPQLFDYVVSNGLGIIACHRRQGRSYEVFPVHWPRRFETDPLERELFLDRYRECLEEAGVLERKKKQLPTLR